jgi:hypothetical protein
MNGYKNVAILGNNQILDIFLRSCKNIETYLDDYGTIICKSTQFTVNINPSIFNIYIISDEYEHKTGYDAMAIADIVLILDHTT